MYNSDLKRQFVSLGCIHYSLFYWCQLLLRFFGREVVDYNENVRPDTFDTVFWNRNYVKPRLNTLIQNASKALNETSVELRYLGAIFPFIDGFPLIPHLSHNDGEKIDLSFVYCDPGNFYDSRKKKSLSGYGCL